MKRRAGVWRISVLFLVLFLLGMGILFHRPLLRTVYVREYSEFVSAYGAEYGVPTDLVYAVIRCESKFQEDAQSSAGACGLMQLTEATFEEILMRLGLTDGDIYSAELNIRCGTFYLGYLYGIYGDWKTVLAAYNAGMGNVNRWLQNSAYSDDGVTLKTVPFSETERYVRKVYDTWEIYRELYQ